MKILTVVSITLIASKTSKIMSLFRKKPRNYLYHLKALNRSLALNKKLVQRFKHLIIFRVSRVACIHLRANYPQHIIAKLILYLYLVKLIVYLYRTKLCHYRTKLIIYIRIVYTSL